MTKLDSYRELFDYLLEGAYLLDREGSITSGNQTAEAISGYPAPELVGKGAAEEIFVHLDESEQNLTAPPSLLKQFLNYGVAGDAAVYLRHQEGFLLPVALRLAPLTNGQGEIVGGVNLFSDQSSKLAVLQKMTGLGEPGWLDRLTGLAGKELTEICIQSYLEELRLYNWPFGLLYLDLDHFGQLNYDYNHLVADRLLQIITKTLARNARSGDFLGRVGGEKFLLAIFNADKANLLARAERYRKLIAHSRLTLNNQPVSVTVSIGATLASPGDSFTSLVERASQAMEKSKTSGRNCVTMSDPP